MRFKLLVLVILTTLLSCKTKVANPNFTGDMETKMTQYLESKGFKNPTTTASGLMYVITNAGGGPQAQNGDMATINFRGKLLNDQEFDSTFKPTNGPLTYKVGSMVKGFDEAVTLLKQGGSGIFIVPPYLGYAEKTVNDPEGKVLIPPSSILAFSIDILEVKKRDDVIK